MSHRGDSSFIAREAFLMCLTNSDSNRSSQKYSVLFRISISGAILLKGVCQKKICIYWYSYVQKHWLKNVFHVGRKFSWYFHFTDRKQNKQKLFIISFFSLRLICVECKDYTYVIIVYMVYKINISR